jgi:hypothetical protein
VNVAVVTPAGEDRRHVEILVVEAPNRLVHGDQRVLQIRSASPRGTQRAQGGRSKPGGGGTGAGGVGDGQPGTVAVLDEIEPVAADFVAR